MSKLNLEKIFPNPPSRLRNKSYGDTYDVLISINKNGGHEVIRFGLINKAALVFSKHCYIEVSDVMEVKDIIYFRSHDEKEHAYVYKLIIRSHKRKGIKYCNFSITRSDEIKNIYKKNWIGEHKLYFDEENEMYYIASK